MPESRPFSPSATASTSGGPGSELKTSSAASATARGVSAHTAPAASAGSADARRRSCTTSSWPPFCRFAAIPEPIMPKPMNPIFIPPSVVIFTPLPLPLVEHLLGHLCPGHRRRPAGIEGEMGDDLAEFVLGQAVIERPVQMPNKLSFAAERDQGCAGDQAAVTLGKAGPLPDLAKEDPFTEVDQPGNDIADLITSRRRLRSSHGFPPCLIAQSKPYDRSTGLRAVLTG